MALGESLCQIQRSGVPSFDLTTKPHAELQNPGKLFCSQVAAISIALGVRRQKVVNFVFPTMRKGQDVICRPRFVTANTPSANVAAAGSFLEDFFPLGRRQRASRPTNAMILIPTFPALLP
jgi:hypothetical protein